MRDFAFFTAGVIVGFALAAGALVLLRRRKREEPLPEVKPKEPEVKSPWFWLRSSAEDRGGKLSAPDGEELVKEYLEFVDKRAKEDVIVKYGDLLGWFADNPDDQDIDKLRSRMEQDISATEEELSRFMEWASEDGFVGEPEDVARELLKRAMEESRVAAFSLWCDIQDALAALKHLRRALKALVERNREILLEYKRG